MHSIIFADTFSAQEGIARVYLNANQLMLTANLQTATERARSHLPCGGVEKIKIKININ